MASVKLAAAALAVLLCAAATTAMAHRPYRPQPDPVQEDCKTQAVYFKNCLSHGYHETCCGIKGKDHIFFVENAKCFCEVEQEAEIECAPGRHCSKIEGKVKISKLKLSCLKKCKRA